MSEPRRQALHGQVNGESNLSNRFLSSSPSLCVLLLRHVFSCLDRPNDPATSLSLPFHLPVGLLLSQTDRPSAIGRSYVSHLAARERERPAELFVSSRLETFTPPSFLQFGSVFASRFGVSRRFESEERESALVDLARAYLDVLATRD